MSFLLRRKVLFISFLSVLLSLLFLYPPLRNTTLKFGLQSYCRFCLDADLKIADLTIDNHQVVINKILMTSRLPLDQGGYLVDAQQATMNFQWHFSKSFFSAEIAIRQPKVLIGISSSDALKGSSTRHTWQWLFQWDKKLTITDGEIHFYQQNSQQAGAAFIPIAFYMDASLSPRLNGEIVGWFKTDPQDKFIIKFDEDQYRLLSLDLFLDHLNLEKLSPYLQMLSPAINKDFSLQGLLKGHLLFSKPKRGQLTMGGELALEDFIADNPLLKASFPNLLLFFQPSDALISEDKDSKWQPNFQGRMVVNEAGNLTFKKGNDDRCEIAKITGGLKWLSSRQAECSLQGDFVSAKSIQPINLEGCFSRAKHENGKGQLVLQLEKDIGNSSIARLNIEELSKGAALATIDFINWTPVELNFLQSLLPCDPLGSVKIWNGKFDFSVKGYWKDFHLSDVKVEKVNAVNARAEVLPWGMSFHAQKLGGDFSLDVSNPNMIKTLCATLSIEQGLCSWAEQTQLYCIDHITTDLTIREGVVKNSIIRGNFAGLKGIVTVNWNNPKELVHFLFKGNIHQVACYAPQSLKRGLLQQFSDDELCLTAILATSEKGLHAYGQLDVGAEAQNLLQDDGKVIAFEFDLDNLSEGQRKNDPAENNILTSFEKLKELFPQSVSSATLTLSDWFNKETSICGFVIRNGTFQANQLPIEKYLSPFLFDDNQLQLSGVVDLHGTFDLSTVSVDYQAQNVCLESDDFIIDVKDIGNASQGDSNHVLKASHYLDIGSGDHFGSLPITNGLYFEKNSGLLFTDISTNVLFEGKFINAIETEAFCNGIYFAGDLTVDCSKPGKGVLDVDILAHTIQGKVSQFQHLFAHFDRPFFFLKIPIEGDVGLNHHGAYVRFEISQDDFDVQARIHGCLNSGALTHQYAEVGLQDLNLDFFYDHRANILKISEIQGAILVGKPDQEEEYVLSGDHISFTDYKHNQGEFDLWLGDKNRDVLRFVGQLKPVIPLEDDADSELVEIVLDRKISHFGDVHPEHFQLVLRDWSLVHAFEFKVGFRLDTLLYDLQRLSRTGLFFVSRNFQEKINDIDVAEGFFKIDLHYDNQNSLLVYQAKSEDIAIGDYKFKECIVNGKKRGNTWTIDQCLLDNISFAADILHEDNGWKLNFLGLRYGSALLVGLEGQYQSASHIFDGRVNLLEADLANLGDIELLKPYMEILKPEGDLRATGKLRACFTPDKFSSLVADLQLNIDRCRVKDIAFTDIKGINCHFVQNKGITFTKIKGGIQADNDRFVNIDLDLMGCSFTTGEITLQGLNFSISSDQLNWVADFLQKHFPEKITSKVAHIIAEAKKKGDVQGALDLTLSPHYHGMRLSLKEGRYFFNNEDYDLNMFLLESDPLEIKMSARCLIEGKPLWIEARTDALTFNTGELKLLDSNKNPSPLLIRWDNDNQGMTSIVSADGKFAGLEIHLLRDSLSNSNIQLNGNIICDLQDTLQWCSPETRTIFENGKVSGFYFLKGFLTFQKNDFSNLFNTSKFSGTLEGKDICCNGYNFLKFTSLIDYSAREIRLRKVEIDDIAGSLQADYVSLQKVIQPDFHDLWKLEVPSLTVHQFKPSLLRLSTSHSSPKGSAFVIRQLKLENLTGYLSDLKTFKAKGHAFFINKSKKSLQGIIFAIPSEILSRLGLDPAMLNPVSGQISYELLDGKVLLTKFKDVYSEGRVTKFYLPGDGESSFIDFDGNVQVQMRMKQQNVLLKLVQPYTITIQGTLQKPLYQLRKSI